MQHLRLFLLLVGLLSQSLYSFAQTGEYLYDPDQKRFLGITTDFPLSRIEGGALPFPLVELPLRVLLVLSNPIDLNKHGLSAPSVEQERRLVEEALAELGEQKAILQPVNQAHLQAIRWEIRKFQPHVLHLVGHGVFEQGKGRLLLEEEDGQARAVDEEIFRELAQVHKDLRLVVLNACRGATRNSQEALAELAPRLVQRGVPAVVAMQYPISDRAALIFTRELYQALVEYHPVDVAVAAGRRAIYLFCKEDQRDWGAPILLAQDPECLRFQPLEPTTTPTESQGEKDSGGIRGWIKGQTAILALIALVVGLLLGSAGWWQTKKTSRGNIEPSMLPVVSTNDSTATWTPTPTTTWTPTLTPTEPPTPTRTPTPVSRPLTGSTGRITLTALSKPTFTATPTPTPTPPTPSARSVNAPSLLNPGFEGIRNNVIPGWQWWALDNFSSGSEYDPANSFETPLFKQADDPARFINGPTLQIDGAGFLKFRVHVFQTVYVAPNATVRFYASARAYTDDLAIKVAAGVDPNGGAGCQDAIWGEIEAINQDDGIVWVIARKVTAGPVGRVTVCLYAEPLYPAVNNAVFFDDATLSTSP